MSTLTVTRIRNATRPRALSLIAAHPPPIFNLPAELVLGILELAILGSSANTLAAVSKAIREVVYHILYRTVVLDSPKAIELFHRTTLSKPSTFFAHHVRRLVVTWEHERPLPSVQSIIAACSGLQVLVSPACYRPSIAHRLSEIVLHSFDGGDRPHYLPGNISQSLTHLRVCEPSDMWFSPESILSTFGSLPRLSHIHLSRRTNGNETNDFEFARDIRMLLDQSSTLRLIVISIFAGHSWTRSSDIVSDSLIWNLIREIQDEDQRVVPLEGKYGEWKDGWQDRQALWSGQSPINFWTRAEANGSYRSS